MKILKVIVLIILLLIAGFAIWLATLPSGYSVSRSVVIDAPVDVVYPKINNLTNWNEWSPWEKLDPNMEKSFSGPEAGEGAVFSWSGNDSVGVGSFKITEAVENEIVIGKLAFTEPWQSESENSYQFEDINGTTKVTWTDEGDLPFIFRFMASGMDDMMGEDFEEGLQQLKKRSEEDYREMRIEQMARDTVYPEQTISSEILDQYPE